MWKKIKDSPYFVLFTQDVTIGYELYITDYVSLWNILFTEKSFLAQLKESNDGLELESDNEFIQKGLHLFSHPDELTRNNIVKDYDENLCIDFKMRCGCPFCFECTLAKASEELFFKVITQSLLKIVSDLRTSQCELRHLLIKKDKEIEEYKCEGEEIVLKHLKTGPFNDEAHMKVHKVYEEYFGESNVSSDLLEKSIKIPHNSEVQTATNAFYPLDVSSIGGFTYARSVRSIIDPWTSSTSSLCQAFGKAEPNLLASSHTIVSRLKEEPQTSSSTEELSIPYSSSMTCKQEVIKSEAGLKKENHRKRFKKLNI